MNKNYFTQGILLLMLFSAPSAWAASPTKSSLADNTKVGIDFGFGMPYAWASKEARDKVKTNPNISLGLMLGYSFPLANNRKIGPEIGINYGFTRRLETTASTDTTLEEKYIQIPLAVKLHAVDEGDFYLAGGLILGYEVEIALSTRYKKDGVEVKDTLPSPLGALLLGGTMDLPKGFYLVAKFKLPVDYLLKKEGSPNEKLIAGRCLSTSFVEFNLGVDITKWFQKS